jgi:hypothetical protein
VDVDIQAILNTGRSRRNFTFTSWDDPARRFIVVKIACTCGDNFSQYINYSLLEQAVDPARVVTYLMEWMVDEMLRVEAPSV